MVSSSAKQEVIGCGVRRQPAAVGLTNVAIGANARIPECWGKHSRRSEPPAYEKGSTVS